MKELWAKIREALYSALPSTAIVYILALTPLFDLSSVELTTFTIGAVLLIVGIGLFSMGADLAMTPMGSHVGAGLSQQRKLGLLLAVLTTGAYHYSMASNYNCVEKPAMVLVKSAQSDIIVNRETLDDLVSKESIPDRLRKYD